MGKVRAMLKRSPEDTRLQRELRSAEKLASRMAGQEEKLMRAFWLLAAAPELLPGEDREVWVYFETPALFRSVDEWRRAYGYPDDVFVYRLTVSKQELVKSFK